MTTITLDEERGVEMLITFKAAAQLPTWKDEAGRILRAALVRDGCSAETIEVEEPFEDVDEYGAPLNAWRVQATGCRQKVEA